MKKKISNIIFTVALFVAVLCLFIIISEKKHISDESTALQEMQSMYVSSTDEAPSAKDETTQSDAPKDSEAQPESVIDEAALREKNLNRYRDMRFDFDGLKNLCPDIYAWIIVPGTCVNYPVLQSEEDNFYLRKGMDGNEAVYGCIYSNASANTKDFTDFNTILYGHNREDNVMFASLHRFDDGDFFEKNDRIFVYTADRVLEYRIYACVKHNDYYLPYLYSFTTNPGKMQYISMLQNPMESPVNHLREDMTVGVDDRLITLSTCMDVNVNRFLVVGVLEEEYIVE